MPSVMKALTATAAMLAMTAQAEPVQWVGLGSNNLWDDAANWNPVKIPQPTDDVTLPANTNAMIGTSNGATANSVLVNANSTLKVVGSNATIGLGGLTLLGNSLLHLDSGAYPFTSAGSLHIGGTSRVDWYSGSLVADVTVGSGAALVVEGAGAHFLTKRLFLSPGSTAVVQGPVLVGFWGEVQNNGGLFHVNTSGFPHITSLNVTNTNNGRLVIDGTSVIQIDTFGANSLTLGAGISVKNNAWVSNVQCGDRASGYFAGVTYISSWSGGTVDSGVAARFYFSGKNRFQSLSSYGSLFCDTGDISTSALHVGGVLNLGQQCPVSADLSSFGSDLFATGESTISVNQAQWFGTIRLGQGLTFRAEKGLVFSGVNTVILDGVLDLPVGSTLNSSSANPIIAVSILAKPGRLNNNGSITVAGFPRLAKLTLTYAQYTGQGSVSLTGNATLDVENTQFQPQSLHIDSKLGKVTGEGASIGWGQLTGSAAGVAFGIIADGGYQQCASPCPYRQARPYQTFEVVQN